VTIKEKEKSGDNVKPSSLAFNLDYLGPGMGRVIECEILYTEERKNSLSSQERRQEFVVTRYKVSPIVCGFICMCNLPILLQENSQDFSLQFNVSCID